MRFLSWVLLPLIASTTTAIPLNLGTTSFTDAAIDSGLALKGLNALALAKAFTKFNLKNRCNPAKVKIRQEWRSISKPQRRKFIQAVKCISAKPSILPPGQVPASIHLYDDLVWAHALRTGAIHNSGYFLAFHRYYIQMFEDALEDCGYNSGLPYWEWGLDVDGPHLSPLFDGSDTSLGSDGEYIPDRETFSFIPFGHNESLSIAPGTGGGCVHTGPFNMNEFTVHLGPYIDQDSNALPAPDPNLPDNPRCLNRDLNSESIRRWTNFRNSTHYILSYDNVFDFQGNLDGDIRATQKPMQLHGGAHGAIGGIARDVRISPNEPAFWLTHANLDRVWWIWQHLDFENRQTVAFTRTWMDLPPSGNATVDDYIEIEPHAPARKVKDLMNTVGGSPLCYVYV
ncbi:Grixazone synthase [Podospora fimiseda]|uniref:Grixazone synthase n=1 Tax=Podospora fimiseda TaxID=252190 RepID=A0AAN7BHZ9_9PEZI|nr:Grixazone synthase [Podospora fimiseda]